MKKKLALLLAFSLLLSLIPASTVMAEEDEDNGYDYEEAYDYDPDEDEDYNDDEDEDDEDTDEDVDEDEDDDEVPPALQPIVPITTTPAAVTVTLRFVIGETTFTRNDVAYTLDAAPYIDAAVGRTMVPLRAISEGLGATVTWDEENRNVNIVRGEINLVLNVDTALPGGMGMPSIREGRTFVPVAYVSEMLGADRLWDQDAQAVYIFE